MKHVNENLEQPAAPTETNGCNQLQKDIARIKQKYAAERSILMSWKSAAKNEEARKENAIRERDQSVERQEYESKKQNAARAELKRQVEEQIGQLQSDFQF